MSLDAGEFAEPHPAVGKQGDDSLISEIISAFNEILNLVSSETGEHLLLRLRRVHLSDRVVLDTIISDEPVGEGSDGSKVTELGARAALKVRQEPVDPIRCELVLIDKGFQACVVEEYCVM